MVASRRRQDAATPRGLGGQGVDAHGIWFAQRAGQLALIYGEGAEDGAIVSKLPDVRAIAAYDAAGAPLPAKLMPSDHLLLLDTPRKPAVVTAVLDNGIWTVTRDRQEVNKPKNEMPGARSAGRYYKYAVHLLGTLQKPLPALPDQTLQLTPVAAVLPRRSSDPLTLRALFEDKPLANAAVTVDFVNDPEGAPMRTGNLRRSRRFVRVREFRRSRRVAACGTTNADDRLAPSRLRSCHTEMRARLRRSAPRQ